MRKLILSSFFVLCGLLSMHAQFQYGGGLSMNLTDSQFGINGRASLGVNESYKAVVGATLYFPKNNISQFATNFDLHYRLVNINDQIRFHPFAGLSIANGNSETDIGLNIGAQFNINIQDDIDIFLEPKFVLDSISGFVLTAGTMF